MNKTKTYTTQNNNNTKTAVMSHRKTTNWTKYSRNLENRGNFSVLLNTAVLNATPTQTKRAGHPFWFSDATILFLAQLREFTQLPLRQTIGLAKYIIQLGGVDLEIPSYITLSRRMAKLNIAMNLPDHFDSPIIFLPDSTGEKITGEGEWFRHKHGAHQRRSWVKVHVGTDYSSRYILSIIPTSEKVHDGKKLMGLLNEAKKSTTRLKIEAVIADGAYDDQELYRKTEKRHIDLIVPPPKNAIWRGDIKHGHLIDKPGFETRNKYVRTGMRIGQAEWKRQVGYHKRSLAETSMWRLKSAFGAKLKSRSKQNQKVEIRLRASLLNLWTGYGLPEYAVT